MSTTNEKNAKTPAGCIGCVAFWRYDKFPFFLGGHIVDMLPDGSVEVQGYGPGYAFDPIKILPAETGNALLLKLEELKKAHDRAQKDFNEEWRAKVVAELPALHDLNAEAREKVIARIREHYPNAVAAAERAVADEMRKAQP